MQDLQSLLSGMLHKEPEHRLTTHQITTHPWFHGFDWQALLDQKLEAPHFEELHVSMIWWAGTRWSKAP
jgi:serine/threonine protein kinase